MNGRAADMSSIQAIASKYSLLLSKMLHRLLCQKPTIHSWYDWRYRLFLLSMAKLISTGQGGFSYKSLDLPIKLKNSHTWLGHCL